MTTTDYLQREIRRVELSIRRAERKPNAPPEEMRGLHEKLEHLKEALEAVEEHWRRVHEQRGWTQGEPLTAERDAAVADLKTMCDCDYCENDCVNTEEDTCEFCGVKNCSCRGCTDGRNWTWRGPQRGEHP